MADPSLVAVGANGAIAVGTAGDSPTLSHEEYRLVVEWCVEQSADGVPVLAGTSWAR